MKKLITTSIILLCLGSVSFAQNAKVATPAKSAKGKNTAKLPSLLNVNATHKLTTAIAPVEAVKPTN